MVKCSASSGCSREVFTPGRLIFLRRSVYAKSRVVVHWGISDCSPDLAPRKPNPIKQQTYECGIETVGETWVQFKVQYYIFALVFLIFDIELVFLFPWAVAFDMLPLFAVFEGILFILILVAGLIYAWRKGVLEWV